MIVERPNIYGGAMSELHTDNKGRLKVVVKDVDIPLGSIIVLMVKIAIAAIPAAVIIALAWMFVAALILGR